MTMGPLFSPRRSLVAAVHVAANGGGHPRAFSGAHVGVEDVLLGDDVVVGCRPALEGRSLAPPEYLVEGFRLVVVGAVDRTDLLDLDAVARVVLHDDLLRIAVALGRDANPRGGARRSRRD